MVLPPKIYETGDKGGNDLVRVRAKSMDSTLGQAATHVVSGASNYPDMDLHGSSETVEWS